MVGHDCTEGADPIAPPYPTLPYPTPVPHPTLPYPTLPYPTPVPYPTCDPIAKPRAGVTFYLPCGHLKLDRRVTDDRGLQGRGVHEQRIEGGNEVPPLGDGEDGDGNRHLRGKGTNWSMARQNLKCACGGILATA